MKISNYGFGEIGNKLKVISIRKDGRFMIENKKGQKEQLASHYEEYYVLYDAKVHDTQLATLAVLGSAVDDANKAYDDFKKKIKGESLISFRNKIHPV